MKTIILDPGHGGMWDGEYCTAGKRSPDLKNGFYEGVRMREIAKTIMYAGCKRYNFICPALWMATDNDVDISLGCRVKKYNETDADLMLSLHSNASAKPGWSGANGSVVFWKNWSDKELAVALAKEYSDSAYMCNRGAKRGARLGILKCKHPSLLIELGFHTNLSDATKLKESSRIAAAIINGLDAVFQVAK